MADCRGYTGILTPTGVNGVVAVTIPGAVLPVATDVITASYSGDTNFAASTGTLAGGQVVNANVISTTTTINAPATANLIYGQQVQLQVVVTANPPSTLTPPKGNLNFVDIMGGQVAPLPGVSSFGDTTASTYITNSLIVGTHSITASYAPPNPQTWKLSDVAEVAGEDH